MNVYKTKDLKEFTVNDYSMFKTMFFNYTFEDDIILKDKKILVYNLDPLVYPLIYDNDVTVITTRKENKRLLEKKFCKEIFSVNADSKTIVNETKEILDRMDKKYDYIFANPPYDDELHLKVNEALLQYVKPNGTLNVIEPLSAFMLKDNKYAKRYLSLFKHVRSYMLVDSKHYSLFNSYNGAQDLGIVRYVQEETSFNALEEWKHYFPEIVNSIRVAIHRSRVPKIKDVITKRLDKGIVVPLTHIGSYKGCTYDDVVYIKDGIAKVLEISKKNGKRVFNGIKNVPMDKMNVHPEYGVQMKTIEQAERFHHNYRNMLFLKGLDWLSHLGSMRKEPELMPYYSFEKPMTEEEIIEQSGLNEEQVAFVKQCASKDFETKHFNKKFYKERLF